MSRLVAILTKSFHEPLVLDFARFLQGHFPSAQLAMLQYDTPLPLDDAIVFANHYMPPRDFQQDVIHLAARSRHVFMLAKGIGYSRSDFGGVVGRCKGLIYRLGSSPSFEGFTKDQSTAPAQNILLPYFTGDK